MSKINTIRAPGKDAEKEWKRLRGEFETTGLYPLIFGSEDDLERVIEQQSFEEIAFEEQLSFCGRGSAEEDLDERLEEYGDFHELIDDGQWNVGTQKLDLVTNRDIGTGKFLDVVVIGLVEVQSPWQVFARLNFGGWNDCPDSIVQCRVQRYWWETYGAEPISTTADIVQCVVARPPQTREEALKLATEQFAYCSDIVLQGVGTITALASTLLHHRYWYFWWD